MLAYILTEDVCNDAQREYETRTIGVTLALSAHVAAHNFGTAIDLDQYRSICRTYTRLGLDVPPEYPLVNGQRMRVTELYPAS